MQEAKKLDLSEVIDLYVEYGSIDKAAKELNCTRQHIDNEIKRQLNIDSGGIKTLITEFYVKAKKRENM